MRLGILGPAQGDLVALARGAQELMDQARAERVIYLSDDDALDRVVSSWARGLVGGDPGDPGVFDRAARRCAVATHEQIEAFVASERARLRLQAFASLPRSPGRTIELIDGRVVLFVYDKATLDEEDIAAASILVFGKSTAPIIKRVGARTFVSPGPVGLKDGGRAVLDDVGGEIRVEIFGSTGVVVAEEVIGQARATKMRVQGGSADS